MRFETLSPTGRSFPLEPSAPTPRRQHGIGARGISCSGDGLGRDIPHALPDPRGAADPVMRPERPAAFTEPLEAAGVGHGRILHVQ